MAEILIKARDAQHPDPQIDRQGCYKRGAPVIVRPDDHEWGRKEGLPNFIVIKLPGVAPATLEALIESQTEDDEGTPVFEPNDGGPTVFRRRRWRMNIDELPPGILTQLYAGGRAAMTPAIFRTHMRRVRDNKPFEGV